MIRSIGRTRLRVVLALLVTAIVPLLTAMVLTNKLILHVSSTAFHPEFGEHLDRALELYADLAKNMKSAMRHEGGAIAQRQQLRDAAEQQDDAALTRELNRALREHPALVSIDVEDVEGESLASVQRDEPMNKTRERPFTVRKSLGEGDEAPAMVAVFAADRTRFDEIKGAQDFARTWKVTAEMHRGEGIDRPYLTTFALLFGLTVLFAIITGTLVVRPVIARINKLAAATKPVAQGDLSVRVDEQGRDEIADLARAFNRMLATMDVSRARIEFLKRVGEWQNMARRLAHEIKNPLTPIQLAVEECHGRYGGEDDGYRELLCTTRDIVVEEVASLRRLVGEFAEFARLPRANLIAGDLGEFMREQRPRLEREQVGSEDDDLELDIDIDEDEMPVAIDRTMLYRVISNLVANAIQAALDGEADNARVRVSTSSDLEHCILLVEDNGPGIPAKLRQTVFDPYMTTKPDGTGLGLTIVKKIVIDHGGQIGVEASDLGGALFRLRLPLLGTSASEAALSQSDAAPMSG